MGKREVISVNIKNVGNHADNKLDTGCLEQSSTN